MNSFGLAMPVVPRVPRTAIALRFFDPITAPTPERPAARCRSFTMPANSTPFSPARPMDDTRISGSWCCFLIVSSVCQTVVPQRCEASRSSASSFSIQR